MQIKCHELDSNHTKLYKSAYEIKFSHFDENLYA